MYFLIFYGCNRVSPFIVSVRDTKEKIENDMIEKISFWNKDQIKENTEIDIESYNNKTESKILSMGKVTDLDYLRSRYLDIYHGEEPCICMPVLALIVYNENGDAISVIKDVNDLWYY